MDLLLDPTDYEKAKKELFPIAYDIQAEDTRALHQAMMIKGFDVELHGKMLFSLSKKANRVTEEVIHDALKMNDSDFGEGACVWRNGDTDVYLPNPDNHVFLLFMHFLHHFFIEGVGLRQICDWCRMLYTYRDSLNCGLLESRIRQAGLMSEWKAFGAMAVKYLGMNPEDVPFLGSMFKVASRPIAGAKDNDSRFDKKADRIMELVLESGNFGQNKDLSYRSKYTGFRYYMVSLWRRIGDFAGFVPLFPADALRFFVTYALGKVTGDNRRVDN